MIDNSIQFKKLIESEENFRNFFNTINDFLSVIDKRGNFIFVNETILRVLGYSIKEMINKHITIIHPEDQHDEVLKTYDDIMKGKVNSCNIPLVTKNGKLIPVETHVVNGTWNNEDTYFCVSKDISQIKKSESKFSKAFHSSGLLMAISSIEEGSFIDVNETFCKTLGYQRKEIIGRTSTELKLFVDSTQRNKVIKTVQKQGYAKNIDVQILTKTGKIKQGIFSADIIKLHDRSLLLTAMHDITERKEAEEALKKSENQWRTLFQNIPDIVIKISPDGKILAINRTIHSDIGQVTGNSIYQMITSQYHKILKDNLYLVFKKKKSVNFQGLGHGPAGPDTSWYEVRIFPDIIDNKCETATMIATDITERKTAEENLLRINKAVENSNEAIGMADSQGNHFYQNKAFTDLFGYSVEELNSAGGPQIVYHDKKIVKEVFRCILAGNSWNGELKMIAKNGRHFSVYLRADAIKDENGELIGVIGIHTDISEQKQVQASLQKSEEQWRTLVHNIPDVVMEVTRKGEIKTINRTLDKSGEDSIGKSIYDLFSSRYHTFQKEVIQQVYKTKKPATYEILGHGPNGPDTTWYETRIVPNMPEGQVTTMTMISTDITERKKAEENLIKINEILEQEHNMFLSGPVVTFKWKNQTNWPVEYVSENVKDIIGYSSKEFMSGKISYVQILLKEELERITDEVMTHSRNNDKNFHHQPYRIIRKDKQIIWVADYTTIIRNEAGKITHYLGYIIDISDLKETEVALRESEERFRLLVETMNDGLVVMNKDHKMTYVNPMFSEMLGYAHGEMIGRKIDDFMDEQNKKTVRKQISSRKKGGHDIYELEWLQKNGGNVPTIVSPKPLTDEKGNFHGSFAVVTDITERKQAEEEIRKSAENLSVTLDCIGEGVIVTDAKGKIMRINPRAQKLTGWLAKEASGLPLSDIFTITYQSSNKKIDNPFKKIFDKGSVHKPEDEHIILISKDGTKRIIAHNGSLIRDKDRNVFGMVLVFRDITEELELQEQLRQSQKMKSIGQLAGGIAHDFNNMLGGIMGYADLLKEEIGDHPELNKYIDRILGTTLKAAHLTKQLVAFSRRGKTQSIAINIHELIKDTITLFESATDKRIEIKKDFNAESATITGDPSQLQNALLNISLNARDAMPEGGALIYHTALKILDEDFCKHQYSEIEPGKYIEIEITDTGEGINTEILDHIFEPFFTTKEVGKGTGLGLAAVYGTVIEHKGAIQVYSEKGKGTTFKLYFKCSDEKIIGQNKKIIENIIHGEGTILVVDDDDAIRGVVKRMLSKLGYTPVIATDGVQAVKLYKKQYKDIKMVILDIVMPKIDGEKTFMELKKINPKVLVLISTGFHLGIKMQLLKKKGVTGFIYKPFVMLDLSQKIAKVLGAL
ncbi:MAG: PAS domain S-box protein [Spirochaetes bacterium]|nr:PAS domain S-box protein [Spirochaetota bacterium]